MELQKIGQIPRTNVTEYTAKDGLIRFHIGNKGEHGQFGQFFSLRVPNSLSYEEALEQFRLVPQLETPEIDDPIVASIMANIGIQRQRYKLNVDINEIVAYFKEQEQGVIQASEEYSKIFLPKLGKKGIKYRLGIFLPNKLIEVAGADEIYDTPPDFCLDSGENKIPFYFSGLIQKFKPGISEQELSSVFDQFDRELNSDE